MIKNVLTDLKDANGSKVEPFICDGTTYLPVRGVAQALGCQVEWDGATQSVKLYKDALPDTTYLMEVCPPYETVHYGEYLRSNNQIFTMGGKKYSNGFTIGQPNGTCSEGNAFFNLNGKFSEIEMYVGHIDGARMLDSTITVYKDGKFYKEYNVPCDNLPNKITIPVSGCLQLKIDMYADDNNVYCGFGNIIVK